MVSSPTLWSDDSNLPLQRVCILYTWVQSKNPRDVFERYPHPYDSTGTVERTTLARLDATELQLKLMGWFIYKNIHFVQHENTWGIPSAWNFQLLQYTYTPSKDQNFHVQQILDETSIHCHWSFSDQTAVRKFRFRNYNELKDIKREFAQILSNFVDVWKFISSFFVFLFPTFFVFRRIQYKHDKTLTRCLPTSPF